MKKKLILVSGKMQSGKNTFANMMFDQFKKNYTISQDLLAGDLKNECKEDFKKLAIYLNEFSSNFINKLNKINIIDKSIINELKVEISKLKINNDNWFEDKTMITRLILQIVGTDIIRNRIDSAHWIKKLKNRIKKVNDDVIIITDVRFPGEIYDMVDESWDIISIRVERKLKNDITKQHESETALDNFRCFSYVIDNNKDMMSLIESSKIVVDDIVNNK